MTDPFPSDYGPLGGLEFAVREGWTIKFSEDLDGRKMPKVPYGAAEVPQAFTMCLWDPDDDEWGSFLFFAVEKGDIALRQVLSAGPDVDQVLSRITAIKPLSAWKLFALRSIIFHTGLPRTPINTPPLFPGEPVRGAAPRLDMDALASISATIDAVDAKAVTRRRNRITDDKLREVATVYRKALADGMGPTRAVQEHFSEKDDFPVSYSTAARWVGMARKVRGGLGQALGFKAGEQTDGE